jgi:hypothetical protein
MLEKLLNLRNEISSFPGMSNSRKLVLLCCVNFMIEFIQFREREARGFLDILNDLLEK